MAKKDYNVESTDAAMVGNKVSRKELGEQRSKIDAVEGIEGTFTQCQRSNDTGDIKLNFELDGHLIRVTVNPITQRVKGRVIHMQ